MKSIRKNKPVRATRIGGIYLSEAKERSKELNQIFDLLYYADENEDSMSSASKSLMCCHFLLRHRGFEEEISNSLAIGLSEVVADAVKTINLTYECLSEPE